MSQAATPLSVEAALAQASFQPYAPIALSPDDRWVAYTLKYPNRANAAAGSSWFKRSGVPSTAVGTRVRITEVQTGRTLMVGNDAATSWAPSWSPDGRYLAFYSDADGVARLWLRETATGRLRRVSNAIVRAHRAIQWPRWTPDSRAVVLPILPQGSMLPEEVAPPSADSPVAPRTDQSTVTVLRADSTKRYGGQAKASRDTDIRASLHADLALVDIASGAVYTLAAGVWPLEYGISADGRYVAFSSEGSPVFRGRWMVPYDVMVVALQSGTPAPPRRVAAGVAITNYSRGLFWSPTSATLLYAATDTAGHENFFAADSDGWQPRRVAASGVVEAGVDSIASSTRAFWWDESGRAFHIVGVHGIATVSMPDGVVRSSAPAPAGIEPLAIVEGHAREAARSRAGRDLIVAFRADSSKRMGFARIDLLTGAWQVLREEDRHYGERRDLPTDVTKDGRILYRSEDSAHPTDIWIARADLQDTRRVTRVAPEIERSALGATRLIEFSTSAGARRRATLLLPADYRAGTRYPLVVYPYPVDDRSNDVNVFGVTGTGSENMQLLATRGIAVLAPDVAPFDWTDEMHELPGIIMPAIDRVIALGIADSSRLGIMGHSWGGYTTLALIAQSTRFRAAVMRGGQGDQTAVTAILQTSGYAYGVMLQELKFGGTLWDRKDIYLKNSPIYLLDRVHTPLLIVHGEAETTVPIFLADQIFAGLQRLGREVVFARYANEDHSESLWSYANRRDYLTRMLGWFTSHLQSNPGTNAHSAP